MFRNYLKIALRSLWKSKGIAAINMVGLSVGLACCMLVSLYIYEETHYDRHFRRAGDLHLVGTTFIRLENVSTGEEHPTFNTPAPMAAALEQEFAEIEKTTRLLTGFGQSPALVRSLENGTIQKAFNEKKGYFADSTYFELFDYEFLEGSPEKALNEPKTVVLSEELARKFFGDAPAYGRSVRISNTWFETGDLDFRVTGVFRQPSAPTHLDGRYFMSLYSGGIGEFLKENHDLASNNMFSTYLLLAPKSNAQALEAKLPAFVEKYIAKDLESRGFRKKQFLTPVPEVHLSEANASGGNLTYLYILGSVALFTLIIACVNFMNLATARSSKRAGEVGIRKAVGAGKYNLIGQFLGESLLLALASFVLALALAQSILPAFNNLAERNLTLAKPLMVGGFFVLALLTGLFAGVYPAFYLSSFRPVEVLKGRFANSLSATSLRKGLVVFQFVISAGLILASLVIQHQMDYLKSKDLGFQKEQQLILSLKSQASVAAYESLSNELRRDSRIASVGASIFYPGLVNLSDMSLFREGQTVEQSVITRMNWVDYGFLTTLGLKLEAGRLFSPEFPADTANRIILNETAVRKIGFSSPREAIGKNVQFFWNDTTYRYDIVGVVKDFHFENLHETIEPYGFMLNASAAGHQYLMARAETKDLPALLASVEQIWKRYVPGEPFEYTFLDEDFQKTYKEDRQMATLIGSFTGIAILISCLGLFGLAAFAAEQRTKEIGIRKVLGASVAGITGLLAKDFLKLVFFAIVIACPLAWWLMQKWLSNFAYRIDVQWWMFALAGIIALAIAFITVSFQSIRAALSNPVKSLRSE
ncbi:MAG: ABC transporter permease [Saprospiraceae bacterium]|nr:ABC transporter permease [Saprospiraceae bacterium]